jgi:general secretion pathway protein E
MCLEVGYRGRTALYELLLINDSIRRLTLQKADAATIRNAGIEDGLITLRFDGARKVMQGLTTPEEVLMVTAEDAS